MLDKQIPEPKEPTGEPHPPRRSARRILQLEISEGLGELRRSASGLFMSGFSAGLDIGFSLFLMAITLSHTKGIFPEPVVELLMANMYSVGFVFVIMGRSELFTEHTTLAVLPVLNRNASPRDLARLWLVVYVSNLCGAALFAWLGAFIGPTLGVIKPAALGDISRAVVQHSWYAILLSAVLAGWLMGLLSWLVAAGRDTISQVVLAWVVTTAIGYGHLHHSILGSVEVLAGAFARQGIGPGDFLHFLVWATLGNAFGGFFFVALIKYGHVVSSDGMPVDVE
jgi:formate/nitrite transporter FocA (FNT family)